MRKNPMRPWLKKNIPAGGDFSLTRKILREEALNTVCESARCPNIFECFSRRTATFLILGDICTRACRFCSVKKGRPAKTIDADEPARIARTARRMGLRRIVITSVTRDDLSDGGAGHFADTINEVRKVLKENVIIEALVPDFNGVRARIEAVANSSLDIFGHNIETVAPLYQTVRPDAAYERSLDVLRAAKRANPGLLTKSAIMLGLGEKRDEVVTAMEDLRGAGCDIIAIGQYLRPSPAQIEVKDFIHPDEFARYGEMGYAAGFRHVNSGVFVRSSYQGGCNG